MAGYKKSKKKEEKDDGCCSEGCTQLTMIPIQLFILLYMGLDQWIF
ncbi:hypothetical protein [Bacillus sp. FJAT-42376]|nr:hypothetical protein [Bacillus sp. FJAT-42376]